MKVLLRVLLVVLISVCAHAGEFRGQVVGVIDGDTISVMREGKAVKVRLQGVDCPEQAQAFGQKGKQFASDKVFGKTVTVRFESKDRYGRVLGEVIIPNGKSLNRSLVKNGFAWWYHKYSEDETLGALEIEARKDKRGLWRDDYAIPPWCYRKFERDRRASPIPAQQQYTKPEIQAPARPSVTTEGGVTVYVTKTGKKYHQDGCRSLSRSKIPISLQDAKVRRYEPCSKCNPPR